MIKLFDVLFISEERDEYDDEFDRMREANLQTRQVQAKEEYADAVKSVDECRKSLAYAKEQVRKNDMSINYHDLYIFRFTTVYFTRVWLGVKLIKLSQQPY